MANILIDLTQIPNVKTGVAIYAKGFISKLKDTANHYYLLVQRDEKDYDHLQNKKIKLIRLKSKLFRNIFFRTLIEQIYIPYLSIKLKISLVHSMHYSFPFFLFCKRLISVHDMTFFLYPEYHLKIKVIYFRFFIRLIPFFADKIVFVSKSTQNDFLKRFPHTKESKIEQIYVGIDSNINTENMKSNKVLNKYSLDHKKYILFIGTIEPRKNLDGLLSAFSQYCKRCEDINLAIIGMIGWKYNDRFYELEPSVSERIKMLGYVDESEKSIILSNSLIFIYPSFYEGFGIPILEAMISKVPVITSNISSMPEVIGDSGLLIEPTKIDTITDAMIKLTDNKELREDLVNRAYRRIDLFSSEHACHQYVELYNRTIRENI